MENFQLGLGTYDVTGAEGVETVHRALEAGYRHIDTAQDYDNESTVGGGIERADVPREEVFLATKVDTENLSYEDVLATTEESLERLGTDYIDLLYVHWPHDAYEPEETLAAFDELADDGTIDHIGLSNFTPDLLAEARDALDHEVFAHQVERHPFLPQEELYADAAEHDTWLVGYSPLAQGAVLDEPVVQSLADKYDATPAQIVLAWHLDREYAAAIPKATGEHVPQNWAAREIELSRQEIGELDDLQTGTRVIDPGWAPWNRA